jgi:hypothetical protein
VGPAEGCGAAKGWVTKWSEGRQQLPSTKDLSASQQAEYKHMLRVAGVADPDHDYTGNIPLGTDVPSFGQDINDADCSMSFADASFFPVVTKEKLLLGKIGGDYSKHEDPNEDIGLPIDSW